MKFRPAVPACGIQGQYEAVLVEVSPALVHGRVSHSDIAALSAQRALAWCLEHKDASGWAYQRKVIYLGEYNGSPGVWYGLEAKWRLRVN